MARMATMETCPTCGATIAKNLAKRLRDGEEGYICPGTTTKQESRKEFEKQWGEDFANAEYKTQFDELDRQWDEHEKNRAPSA